MARVSVKTLYMRKWSRNNKEKCRENCKNYHNELKDDDGYKQDKINRTKQWRLDNPEKYKKGYQKQNKKRSITNG